MPDYSKGKIYKIECNITHEVYYGSTSQKYLRNRLAQHKSRMACSVSKILCRENYTCKLIEEYPCNSKLELQTRERYYIENNQCINKQIPGGTAPRITKDYSKEYYKNNKEKIREKNNDWREKNKEKIKGYYKNNKEQKKEYYKTNKEKMKEYYKNNKEKMKEYYKNNKEKILQRQNEYNQNKKEKNIISNWKINIVTKKKIKIIYVFISCIN